MGRDIDLDAAVTSLTDSDDLSHVNQALRYYKVGVEKPIESWTKRFADIVISCIGLLILSPLFLAVSLAIVLTSPGPALFRQTRYGLAQATFTILKFRTMTVMESGASAHQASRDDPRVTRIGHFIRRTSIDELPQLWNVLRGEMSLVGPRPHATVLDDLFEDKIPNYSRRFEAKPGITGLAQIRGQRGATTTREAMAARVRSDIEYIDGFSFSQDIKILLSTAKLLLGDDKAY